MVRWVTGPHQFPELRLECDIWLWMGVCRLLPHITETNDASTGTGHPEIAGTNH
jgi:hypothetical protein